jgi:hypothetical protein
MSKSYERAEILELGAADALTLGGKGCRDDGCDCQENGDVTGGGTIGSTGSGTVATAY